MDTKIHTMQILTSLTYKSQITSKIFTVWCMEHFINVYMHFDFWFVIPEAGKLMHSTAAGIKMALSMKASDCPVVLLESQKQILKFEVWLPYS